jgi:DNA gyrase subunit A
VAQHGENDRLIGVSLLSEEDDIFLATRKGRAIRFEATAVREFQSRQSTGVRGITLRDDDEVISLSILRRFDATTEERDDYLNHAPWYERRSNLPPPPPRQMSDERFAEFVAAEEFVLTMTECGYGKRTSAFEYRRTNRGGVGITNIDLSDKGERSRGDVVATFTAHDGDQIMLVTNQAKTIRMTVRTPVPGEERTSDMISVVGRNSAGVRLLDVASGERVTSAARIDEEEEPETEAEAMVAEELGEAPAAAAADTVQLDDGTGPETLPDSQE